MSCHADLVSRLSRQLIGITEKVDTVGSIHPRMIQNRNDMRRPMRAILLALLLCGCSTGNQWSGFARVTRLANDAIGNCYWKSRNAIAGLEMGVLRRGRSARSAFGCESSANVIRLRQTRPDPIAPAIAVRLGAGRRAVSPDDSGCCLRSIRGGGIFA